MSSHLALKTVWILISWLLQKPADLDLHCLQEKPADQDPYCLQELIYIWFYTVFERIKCLSTVRYKLICSFGQVKNFYGQVHFGFLHVPGQVENFTISTSLIISISIFSICFSFCSCHYIKNSDIFHPILKPWFTFLANIAFFLH